MKRVLLPMEERAIFFPSVPESINPLLLANSIAKQLPKVVMLIDASITQSEKLGEDACALLEFIQPKQKIDFLLFDEIPESTHPEAFERHCDRISALSQLAAKEKNLHRESILVIASTPDAILSPCPLLNQQQEIEITLSKGETIAFEKLRTQLAEKMDYSCEILCEEPGQFSVRGGLIDIYPVNGNEPVRIDFFGDEIEEIRAFDPTNQRSTHTLSDIRIASANPDQLQLREGEFFKYLQSKTLWYFKEPEQLVINFPLAFHQSELNSAQKENFSSLWNQKIPHENLFIGTSEIDAGSGIFEKSQTEVIEAYGTTRELQWNAKSNLSQNFETEKRNRVSSLFHLLERQKDGYEIMIGAGADSEVKRIQEIIKEESSLQKLKPRFIPVGLDEGIRIPSEHAGASASLFLKNTDNGFLLATTKELLGRERSRRPIRSRKARVQRKEVDQALDFSELIDGDYLVHLQHGICRFVSIGTISENNQTEETITVEFDDALLLHVPLQESHLLSRYVGLSKAKPKLAKLGGKSWAKTKQAAELAAMDLAADLLRLQASRESGSGYAFSIDDQWQKEFEDAFPYTETPDQQKAINQVKEDMEKEEPMDRLVCGDVGFGKTEVALRAAFKAIMDGKQVALLCPTTILCQQHLNVFRERMMDFPISVEMLSRFRTKGQQTKITKALNGGSIDLLIGTHRLLSSDVSFKDLGLLIIDEEQRFGVKHKEAIKKLKSEVDVLTLSATPIPRTLYFAMVGARALSTIETAPVNRRPIRTEVVHKTDQILHRAIDTEIRRGGQIFYLHNRVKTINRVAQDLQAKFPKLRIAVGHGQMNEDELEEIMTNFVAGKYDILVCTTIIESGLDIPNCNTIIIEGADKFGLSQLYQLRGRVGRFTKQAYAYLLLNRNLTVSDQARKRLSAIRQINDFGAGFRIALRDLELRGSGNLLGSEQSGHVAGVGFEMYCRLLKESVSRLKGEEISLRPAAVVRLDFLEAGPVNISDSKELKMGAYLPESYTQEPRIRIEGYRKIANIRSEEEISEYRDELMDRFGPLPPEVEALLLETQLRCLCEEAQFDLLETEGSGIRLRMVRTPSDKTQRFYRVMGKYPNLSAKKPLLKLKELIRFLKINLHGKKDEIKK